MSLVTYIPPEVNTTSCPNNTLTRVHIMSSVNDCQIWHLENYWKLCYCGYNNQFSHRMDLFCKEWQNLIYFECPICLKKYAISGGDFEYVSLIYYIRKNGRFIRKCL